MLKCPLFSSIRLTGNGILRAAHLAHYTNNASAALIGVVGSLISVFILWVFSPCIPKTRDENGNEKIHGFIQTCMWLLHSTLCGTIGSAVLRGHVDLGGIDILHATRAGALGGAILGPGSVLIAPWVLATIFLVFSPVWLAISMGARWVGERSSGDWTERNRSYSYCYCCGTRDDPAWETNAEFGIAGWPEAVEIEKFSASLLSPKTGTRVIVLPLTKIYNSKVQEKYNKNQQLSCPSLPRRWSRKRKVLRQAKY